MKKKHNWFLRLISVLFLVFIVLYVASSSGYYERNLSHKVALTDAAIEEFERDVLDGKEVDIKDYLKNDTNDYSNSFTKAGDNLTSSVEIIINKGFKGIWDIIELLFL